jgi:iron complex transport system ATP-binding protein
MTIRVNQIEYQIGAKSIVRDVSTLIRPGQMTALIGPNGAGKSSLVKLICGEISPNSGNIYIENVPLALIGLKEQARIRSVMTQNTTLAFDFSVSDVLELAWHSGNFVAFEARKRRLAANNELVHLLDQNFRNLSGGEQQRVLFARALLQLEDTAGSYDGRYLFLDEPTAHLDIKHELHTLQSCRDYTEDGLGVVTVLHDLNLAARFADRILLMKNGQIVSQGLVRDVLTADNLSESYETPIEVQFDESKNRLFIHT